MKKRSIKTRTSNAKRLNAGKEDEFTMKSLKYIATLLIVVLVLSLVVIIKVYIQMTAKSLEKLLHKI